EENTLTRHISTLRRILGDDLRGHRYVLTVVGQGYQFVADVVPLEQRPAGLEVDYGHTVAAEAPDPDAEEIGDDHAHAGAAEARQDAGDAEEAREPTSRARSRFVIPAIGLTIAAAVLVALMYRAPRPEATVTPQVHQLTFLAGLQRNPAWSPDGKTVVFSSDRGGKA